MDYAKAGRGALLNEKVFLISPLDFLFCVDLGAPGIFLVKQSV